MLDLDEELERLLATSSSESQEDSSDEYTTTDSSSSSSDEGGLDVSEWPPEGCKSGKCNPFYTCEDCQHAQEQESAGPLPTLYLPLPHVPELSTSTSSTSSTSTTSASASSDSGGIPFVPPLHGPWQHSILPSSSSSSDSSSNLARHLKNFLKTRFKKNAKRTKKGGRAEEAEEDEGEEGENVHGENEEEENEEAQHIKWVTDWKPRGPLPPGRTPVYLIPPGGADDRFKYEGTLLVKKDGKLLVRNSEQRYFVPQLEGDE